MLKNPIPHPKQAVLLLTRMKAGMGRFSLRYPLLTSLPRIFLSILVIPMLFIVDVVLFQFTRPSCAGCASFSQFITQSSLSAALLQQLGYSRYLLQIFHSYER